MAKAASAGFMKKKVIVLSNIKADSIDLIESEGVIIG